MSELLESVKRLAEYQERTGTQLTLNYIALAKHLARLERVEAAAKRLSWAERLEGEAKGAQLPRDRIIDAECATMMALNELRAALSENPDAE